jgi:Transposase IS200 like
MPRIGRVVLPNYPHHIVQRGHNRRVVFAETADFEYYLATLAEFKIAYDVRVYGFCLMTNHVHLILGPGEAVTGLGQLMKRLAGRQLRQPPGGTPRYAVGEPIQVEPSPDRGLSARLLSLCRVQPGAGRHDGAAGKLSMVELSTPCRAAL